MRRQLTFAGLRSVNVKAEWLTPPEIVRALGEFDLDPCSPVNRPWDLARRNYTIDDDGLAQEWTGRVWCNPPYGDETALWLERMRIHGNGVALTFARTETAWFFDSVWGGERGGVGSSWRVFLQGKNQILSCVRRTR